ncbi:hypothetical protein AG1IA_09933 [Rhizoctonia solani AG-1 IA]|uniref:Secreted protein n=1 Tax=Thanatephorus cucumeris (strain AG1-IA) TaxID=983506 RepID=L8WH27_THACA|nr:hypothetical protein AG1IA_09933 [Rhizoctonia solani AG-1 IA]
MGHLLPVHFLAILLRFCQLGTHRMGRESSLALMMGPFVFGMCGKAWRPLPPQKLVHHTSHPSGSRLMALMC